MQPRSRRVDRASLRDGEDFALGLEPMQQVLPAVRRAPPRQLIGATGDAQLQLKKLFFPTASGSRSGLHRAFEGDHGNRVVENSDEARECLRHRAADNPCPVKFSRQNVPAKTLSAPAATISFANAPMHALRLPVLVAGAIALASSAAAQSSPLADRTPLLSETDRLTLVTRLLETMPNEVVGLSLDDPHLIEELDRRSNDRAGAIDWSDLKSQH